MRARAGWRPARQHQAHFSSASTPQPSQHMPTSLSSRAQGWVKKGRTLSLGTTAPSSPVSKRSDSVSDCDVSPPLRNAAPRSSRSRAIFEYSSARRAGTEPEPPGAKPRERGKIFTATGGDRKPMDGRFRRVGYEGRREGRSPCAASGGGRRGGGRRPGGTRRRRPEIWDGQSSCSGASGPWPSKSGWVTAAGCVCRVQWFPDG